MVGYRTKSKLGLVPFGIVRCDGEVEICHSHCKRQMESLSGQSDE